MRTPKFAVGELVRVDSRDHPHLNGVFTVLAIRDGVGFEPVGRQYIFGTAYKLDDGVPKHQCWSETALRKIGPPGDDFWRFMDKVLSKPVVLEEDCPSSIPVLGQSA